MDRREEPYRRDALSAGAPATGGMSRVASIRHIHYADAQGVTWRVYERDSCGSPSTRLPCLCFMSAERIRLVRIFPQNWPLLSATALEALSWQR